MTSWIAALATVLVIQAADEAPAPELSEFEGLLSENVQTAASRSAETSADAPATTWTITGSDLRLLGLQSLEEALRYLGHGMTTYPYDNEQNAAFGSRGYMSDNLGLHLAVLIDGNQAGGSSLTARGTVGYFLPLELVDRLEILLGPGSVLYGNSAMLGVVNVILKHGPAVGPLNVQAQTSLTAPSDRYAKDPSWGGVMGKASLWGSSRIGVDNPFEITWSLAARWDRSPRRRIFRGAGVDLWANTAESAFLAEDVINRDLRVRGFARATWGKWTFMASQLVTGGTGPGAINSGSGQSAYLDPETLIDARWESPVSDRGSISLRGYATFFGTTVDTHPYQQTSCDARVGSPCVEVIHYTVIRPYLEPLFQWDWASDGTQVSTLGAQVFADISIIDTYTRAGQGGATTPRDPIIAPIPNGALYAQHIWRTSATTLNLGVRGDIGFIASAVSPRAAFGWNAWSGGTLKLVFSSAFRAPTITERFLEIPGFLADNPNIAPEHVYSLELDLAQRLGIQNFQLSVFGAIWNGMIGNAYTQRNAQWLVQFANLRSVWSAGFNIGWRGAVGPLKLHTSLSYAPGRVRLPADVGALSSDEQRALNVSADVVARWGSRAFGQTWLQTEGMSDFYANASASLPLGNDGVKVGAALSVFGPRPRMGYLTKTIAIDPRFAGSAYLPWGAEGRVAIEREPTNDGITWRLGLEARSFNDVPSEVRVASGEGPNTLGQITNLPNLRPYVGLNTSLGYRF